MSSVKPFKIAAKDKALVGERFRTFRQTILKTQSELAADLNLPQSTISCFELGKRLPTFDILSFLVDMFSLNIHWLATGDGEMFAKKDDGELKLTDNEDFRHLLEDMNTDTDILNSILIRYNELKQIKKFKEITDHGIKK